MTDLLWFHYLLRSDSPAKPDGVNTRFSRIGVGLFRYFVFNDPGWMPYNYDFSNFPEDTKFASSYLDITDPDFSAFSKKGGKILMCQGWADWAVSPFNTTEFYHESGNLVIRTVLRNPGLTDFSFPNPPPASPFASAPFR